MRTLKTETKSEIRTEARIFYDNIGDKIYITGSEEKGFWYAAKGSLNVNFTLSIAESDNIEEWKDLDYFSYSKKILSLEMFIEAVEA